MSWWSDTSEYIELDDLDAFPAAVRGRAMNYRYDVLMRLVKKHWNGKRVSELVYSAPPFLDFIP